MQLKAPTVLNPEDRKVMTKAIKRQHLSSGFEMSIVAFMNSMGMM
jgi:hypothetical protein